MAQENKKNKLVNKALQNKRQESIQKQDYSEQVLELASRALDPIASTTVLLR
ncbi:12885_t:CDS:2 [Racocetra fulgida]|uniref:12885_t:CDS:1 n=1 Tax=Racocetra fulgida TaxID=60492 RepID=A0A9N8WPS6_9GLOM|nr:12885_t:CDS:2 [Racocetra fulgida]